MIKRRFKINPGREIEFITSASNFGELYEHFRITADLLRTKLVRLSKEYYQAADSLKEAREMAMEEKLTDDLLIDLFDDIPCFKLGGLDE